LIVRELRLRNYRNVIELEIEFDSSVNLLLGSNAQGKTNILEAIGVLAIGKSHRTNKDKEMVRWESEQTVIAASLTKKSGTAELEIRIGAEGKRAKINGLNQNKLSQYIGTLKTVIFAPEDLDMIKGTPTIRRRFLDMELTQIEPSYLHHLSTYQKTLIQRNHLLKDTSSGNNKKTMMDVLEVWNEQLAIHGSKMITKRQNFIEKLQRWSAKIHSGITDGEEQLQIKYMHGFEDTKDESTVLEQFVVKLSELREQEFRRGMTLVGPHRDDLVFIVNGKEVQLYGSQGQQRTVALSVKLAEIDLIFEETGEYPVLLLDDVLSELDEKRQTRLIESFQDKVQTFITGTGMENIQLHKLGKVRKFIVQQGAISREQE
jgi:DNA replication and repair protein RecF